MTPFVFIALILLGGSLAIAAVRSHQRKVDAAWKYVAQEFGFTYRPPGVFTLPRIAGRVDDCEVVVEVFRKSSGKHSESRTRYTVRYPTPLELDLRLTREKIFAGVAKLFGSQDIEVGDAAFDDAVMVKGQDEQAVIEFLTPARRMRIVRLLTNFDEAVIDDQGITWSRRHTETNPSRMAGVVRRLVRNALALHGRPSGEDDLDAALAARREGHLDEALELTRQAARASGPTPPEVPLVEGDILATGGRFQEAEEAYARVKELDPVDHEATALAAEFGRRAAAAAAAAATVGVALRVAPRARLPATDEAGSSDAGATESSNVGTSASVETRPEEPGTPGPPGEDIEVIADADPASEDRGDSDGSREPDDVETICRNLFGGNRMSLEVSRHFDESFKGRQVSWKGVLRQARSYSFDLVFGNDPGSKAVVEICQLKPGPFGRTVQAVLQLPAEDLGALEARIGNEVQFEGRLVGCDAFMCNLFVADARLL